MASESYKESQEVFVVSVSNEDLQKHLKSKDMNIDIAVTFFREKEVKNQQYSMSNDTYATTVNENTSNNSTGTDSNNTESTGGVQNPHLEFDNSGSMNNVVVLDPKSIMSLYQYFINENGEVQKVGKEQKQQKAKEDRE